MELDDAVPKHADDEITKPTSVPDGKPITYKLVRDALRHARSHLEGVYGTSDERVQVVARVKHWIATALVDLEEIIRRQPHAAPALELVRLHVRAVVRDVERLLEEARGAGLLLVGRVRSGISAASDAMDEFERRDGARP